MEKREFFVWNENCVYLMLHNCNSISVDTRLHTTAHRLQSLIPKWSIHFCTVDECDSLLLSNNLSAIVEGVNGMNLWRWNLTAASVGHLVIFRQIINTVENKTKKKPRTILHNIKHTLVTHEFEWIERKRNERIWNQIKTLRCEIKCNHQ